MTTPGTTTLRTSRGRVRLPFRSGVRPAGRERPCAHAARVSAKVAAATPIVDL